MTEIQVLQWIKTNVAPFIRQAISDSQKANLNLLYTEDWLAAICMRETGGKIAKKLGQGFTVPGIWVEMKGDYTQRHGEPAPKYHGFSLFQIDIASFPEWIKAGRWTDPYQSALKAISVLEGKRRYIQSQVHDLAGEALERAITAAYNCGEGNTVKSLLAKRDVDSTTTEKNYSADVFRLRALYKALP